LVQNSCDNLNRLVRKTVPERAGLAATHTRDVFYRYDLRNLPLDVRFDSLTGEGVANQYDGFGRLASSTLTMDGIPHPLSHHNSGDTIPNSSASVRASSASAPARSAPPGLR
jgi:hypothetical protein